MNEAADAVRPKVAITRGDLFGDPKGRLSAIADVTQREGVDPPAPEELIAFARDADAILGLAGDPVTADVLDALPKVRVVSLASAGFDSIDVPAAASRGVVITNAPGVLSEAVADTTFGLILGARRRLVEADRYVRAGRWTESALELMVGPDVYGARLGLIGYGGIGRAVARRAKGFGMDVVFFDAYAAADDKARSVSLDELLRTSDVVSLHCPLTPETRGIINEQALRIMKRDATLVNTARGPVVDEPALVRALQEGWIGSAGLDVQHVEPNPDANSALLACPNAVVLPHIGSASNNARLAMTDVAVRNIEAVLGGGDPLTTVPGWTPATPAAKE